MTWSGILFPSIDLEDGTPHCPQAFQAEDMQKDQTDCPQAFEAEDMQTEESIGLVQNTLSRN